MVVSPLFGRRMWRLSSAALILLLVLTVGQGAAQPAYAQEAGDALNAQGPRQNAAPNTFLPMVSRQVPPDLADRIGFGAGTRGLNEYPEIGSMQAGWYVDWATQLTPVRPNGIEYMQMVQVHQKLTCPAFTTADRNKCPYEQPYGYTVTPGIARIKTIAQANPGSMWLIGNEPDRPDWAGGGQNEMMPELYAQAYHEIHTAIKSVDPFARVAVAGIIQMTDLREAYLDKMWNHYRQVYGVDMPVDIWNVHNFVGSEDCRYNASNELICYGMGVPPDALWGSPQVRQGAYLGEDWRHTYMPTFEAQIRRFRQWMKDHGQQNKELIVTEYGVLYKNDITCPTGNTENAKACKAAYPSGIVPLTDGNHVRLFMLNSFNLFLNAKDCSLSSVDDCRLVQRWAWFSVDAAGDGYNAHGALFNEDTRAITETGKAFRDWVNANFPALRR